MLERATVARREDVTVRVAVRRGQLMRAQRRQQARRELHRTAAPLRLQLHVPPAAIELVCDRDAARIEIDTAPLEPQDLAQARAAPGCKCEDQAVAILRHREQQAELFSREHASLALV